MDSYSAEGGGNLSPIPLDDGESLHDELLSLMRSSGMESIAKEAGVIKNGSIPGLKEYNTREYNTTFNSHFGLSTPPITPRRQTNENPRLLEIK